MTDLGFTGARVFNWNPYRPPLIRASYPLCEVLAPELNPPSTKLLHALMSRAGLWPDDCRWTTVSKGDDGVWHGCADRPAYSPFLLLVGAGAMHWWRGDLTLGRTRGSVYRMGTPRAMFAVMPITHPETILVGKNRLVKDDAVHDLSLWADVCKGVVSPLEHRRDRCVGCDGFGVVEIEPDWVPWCGVCWAEKKAAEQEREIRARSYKIHDARGKVIGRTVLSEGQQRFGME